MEFRFIILCIAFFQTANSQYYSVPASSYPSCNNYYPLAPSYAPAPLNLQPNYLPSLPKTQKRNIEKPLVKCSPQTASAYFLSVPSEKVIANVLTKEKVNEPKRLTPYSCPLCNNFANVPPSAKISPPPPVGSPVLSGTLEKIASIGKPKNIVTKDPSLNLSSKTLFSDMYEKHKVPKKLSFDQELLEGFLTGLGIAL